MTDFGLGIEFRVPLRADYEQILTPEAVAFAVSLQRTFNGRRKQLLEDRTKRQARLDGGETISTRRLHWRLPNSIRLVCRPTNRRLLFCAN